MRGKQMMTEDPEMYRKIISVAESRLKYREDAAKKIQILKEAFALIPEPVEQWEDPTAYIANNLCVEYHVLGKNEEAIKWGELAVKAREEMPDTGVFVNLGIAYYAHNDLDKALHYFDQAYNTRNAKNRAFLGYEPVYFDFYRERKGIKIKKKK